MQYFRPHLVDDYGEAIEIFISQQTALPIWINYWLEIRFEERELYNKNPGEANVECIKELLED